MVFYFSPWSSTKQIGKSYNQCMELLPHDHDWACFTDGDTLFTTYDYGKQIEEVIAAHPTCRAFTAYTNRVGCKWQVAPGSNWENDDMEWHRAFGLKLQQENRTKILDYSRVSREHVMSGFLILIRKDLWRQLGGFREEGMLGVDNDLHYKIMRHREKFYLMTGVYLYHWYRGGGTDKSHLL